MWISRNLLLSLERRIEELERRQIEFEYRVRKDVKEVQDNDKKMFAYEVRKEDIELIEDGVKFRKIMKVIN